MRDELRAHDAVGTDLARVRERGDGGDAIAPGRSSRSASLTRGADHPTPSGLVSRPQSPHHKTEGDGKDRDAPKQDTGLHLDTPLGADLSGNRVHGGIAAGDAASRTTWPLEAVYQNYRQANSLAATPTGWTINAALTKRISVQKQLEQHGFTSIEDFEAFIKKAETTFEQRSAAITRDLLAKLSAKLHKESIRYKTRAEIDRLHNQLGGLRKQRVEREKHAPRPSVADALQASLTYSPAIPLPHPPGEGPKVEKAEQVEIRWLARTHPVFREDGLPAEKRIDRKVLTRSSKTEIAALLQQTIAQRIKDIADAISRIDDNPELIYKIDKLIPEFYRQIGIVPGTIQDMIVRDKKRSLADLQLASQLLLSLLAIALSIISGGATSPLVGAAVGAGGLGISAYTVISDYLEYTEQKVLADAGLADDPSALWLVLSCATAALDLAATKKVVEALLPAARQLDASGDVAAYLKQVNRAFKQGKIDERTSLAIQKWVVNKFKHKPIDFRGTTHLYPHEKSVIRITYTGSYTQDFKTAFAESKIVLPDELVGKYVWHHFDYDPLTNTGQVQFITMEAHRLAIPHRGGVRDYELIHKPYKS
jgi:hypothetical protein